MFASLKIYSINSIAQMFLKSKHLFIGFLIFFRIFFLLKGKIYNGRKNLCRLAEWSKANDVK